MKGICGSWKFLDCKFRESLGFVMSGEEESKSSNKESMESSESSGSTGKIFSR